jgi:hypothetical protein
MLTEKWGFARSRSDRSSSDLARMCVMASNGENSAETTGKYQVIGIRANGERIVISTHSSRHVADKVINLIQNGSGFAKLTIEPDAGDGAE